MAATGASASAPARPSTTFSSLPMSSCSPSSGACATRAIDEDGFREMGYAIAKGPALCRTGHVPSIRLYLAGDRLEHPTLSREVLNKRLECMSPGIAK
jgi:hypothetical protein